jgi:hypothetical protein
VKREVPAEGVTSISPTKGSKLRVRVKEEVAGIK